MGLSAHFLSKGPVGLPSYTKWSDLPHRCLQRTMGAVCPTGASYAKQTQASHSVGTVQLPMGVLRFTLRTEGMGVGGGVHLASTCKHSTCPAVNSYGPQFAVYVM